MPRKTAARPPAVPPARPGAIGAADAMIEATELERDLDALRWRMEMRARLPPGWSRVERDNPIRPRKVKITLRLDEDVAYFFRRQGEGYQGRVNAVLRWFMLARIADPD